MNTEIVLHRDRGCFLENYQNFQQLLQKANFFSKYCVAQMDCRARQNFWHIGHVEHIGRSKILGEKNP